MRAIYAFSGDPITWGHIDIVRRAARTYDEVVVAIGENPNKQQSYLFTKEERLVLARRCLADLPNVRCRAFHGLLGEYAYRQGFDVIVRGVRNAADLENEMTLSAVNLSLHATVDTMLFPARPQLAHVSSGTVKAIVREGGDVTSYCPMAVKEELEKRLRQRFMVGVAGGLAAGKTHVARRLVELIQPHLPATYISLDAVGHHVLAATDDPVYRETRRRIAARFGRRLMREDGSIDRRQLGRIVFSDAAELADLDRLMREPLLARLYEETNTVPSGVVILEGAILVEARWTQLVNNNVVLLDAPEEMRVARMVERNHIPREEALAKIHRQISARERKELMQRFIREHRWGRLWELDHENTERELPRLAETLRRLATAPIAED